LLARFARILKVPPSFFFRGLTTVADNDDEEALRRSPIARSRIRRQVSVRAILPFAARKVSEGGTPYLSRYLAEKWLRSLKPQANAILVTEFD